MKQFGNHFLQATQRKEKCAILSSYMLLRIFSCQKEQPLPLASEGKRQDLFRLHKSLEQNITRNQRVPWNKGSEIGAI